mmetsp:Transcript_9922/g.18296  ORF Transcript_9922/g.18296 Transcript_9922/m.18296 type:complete len:214 (-) Transcript_9922:29-670(-)
MSLLIDNDDEDEGLLLPKLDDNDDMEGDEDMGGVDEGLNWSEPGSLPQRTAAGNSATITSNTNPATITEMRGGKEGQARPMPPTGAPAEAKKGSVFKEAKGDPNMFSLSACSKDLAKSFDELETSVTHLLKLPEHDTSKEDELVSDCLLKLKELNGVCDQLSRLVARKKDILAVERVLLKRTEDNMDENPQVYVETQVENLWVSRSEFQKVLL